MDGFNKNSLLSVILFQNTFTARTVRSMSHLSFPYDDSVSWLLVIAIKTPVIRNLQSPRHFVQYAEFQFGMYNAVLVHSVLKLCTACKVNEYKMLS